LRGVEGGGAAKDHEMATQGTVACRSINQ